MEKFRQKIEGEPASEEQESIEVKYEAIDKLREPIRKILEQISENIDRGEYGFIIGDDASGRIPALIFDRVLKTAYREKKYPDPRTLFFAGSRRYILSDAQAEENKRKMGEYLDGILAAENKKRTGDKGARRALLVTDTIASGSSLQNLADVLKEKGIPFDIACIGLIGAVGKQRIEGNLGGKIFSGGSGEPLIYGRHALGGVIKKAEDLFSKSIKSGNPDLFDAGEIGNTVREARKDVQIVADELSDWYKGGRKPDRS